MIFIVNPLLPLIPTDLQLLKDREKLLGVKRKKYVFLRFN